jgi:hypothetical protein
MEFRTTNRTDCRAGAFSFVELMIASAMAAVVGATIFSFSSFSGRSFSAMGNYYDLDRKSRGALDQISRDVRRCQSLASYATNKLVFIDADGANLTYSYDAANKQLTRVKGTTITTNLTECDYLKFGVYQRTPIGGTYEQFTNATAATCKLVQLEWVCSRKILGSRQNTESVQSAKIVIRKK